MRNVILYIATSIDGYIADIDGGVSWLEGDGSDQKAEGTYMQFIQNIDSVVMGYKTYKQILEELSPNQWPYEGLHTYVITHREIPSSTNVSFTKDSPSALIAKLKEQEGKDIWICGGASIVNQLLEAKLIDKLIITSAPTILGRGKRLFEEVDFQTKLSLESSVNYNGFVESSYTIKK